MIRLSKMADYSFVLLNQMLSKAGASWSAADLAEATGLPLPTVAKLMKLMGKMEILTAQRGAAGGYRLAKDPAVVTVADIIEAVDGPISLTQCVNEHEPDCAVQNFCGMRGGWDKMNAAVKQALSTVTLKDMAQPVDASRRVA